MRKFKDLLIFARKIVGQNRLVSLFVFLHVFFAIFLGRLYALAPDEGGYLYTFNNLYGSKDANPQLNSGWITAPKLFLWIAYLPAKVLNLCGVPDYLSIRFLSIFLGVLTITLIKNLYKGFRTKRKKLKNAIFLFFFIPSLFLWVSVGLRESFILAEMALIFAGISYLFENRNGKGSLYLFLGSYGLLSTKSYLWICLIASVILVFILLMIQRTEKRRIINLVGALVLVPSLFFATTTSWGAFEFIVASVFHTDVSSVAARSGDSIIQIAVPHIANTPTASAHPTTSVKPTSSVKPTASAHPTKVLTFHGDTTLIILHFYLLNNPKATFTKVLTSLGVTAKIQTIWNDKVKTGLIKKSVKAIPDSSSLNGYILRPGSIHRPTSNIRPTLLFLFGPIPLVDHGGIALDTVALETPLWWFLYALVLFQFIRFRRLKYWRDPPVLLASIYLATLVLFSELVEVNLGTSFRHRSILFVLLIFLYVRIRTLSDRTRVDIPVSR